MAPNINNPGGVKNADDEIRDGVVSDATKFPGANIDLAVSESGAPVRIGGTFEVTNAAFFSSFDVSAQVGRPAGVSFSADGSQMYVVGSSAADIVQFSLSTAFDATTASFDSSFDVRGQASGPSGMTFKPDGSEMYVIGFNQDSLFQYSLTTPFDVSTAGFTGSFDVSTQAITPKGVSLKPDGSSIYVCGGTATEVFQYSLPTAFDVTSAFLNKSFDVSAQSGNTQDVAFNSSGSRMYVTDSSNDSVFQYSLSTAFDVSTASFTSSFDLTSQLTIPVAVSFNSQGSSMYIVSQNSNTVFQYIVGQLAPDPL